MTTKQFIAVAALTLAIMAMLGILYVRVSNYMQELESRIPTTPVTTYGQK